MEQRDLYYEIKFSKKLRKPIVYNHIKYKRTKKAIFAALKESEISRVKKQSQVKRTKLQNRQVLRTLAVKRSPLPKLLILLSLQPAVEAQLRVLLRRKPLLENLQ